MTVLGLDDTDSRERGMCTTYVGYSVASALRDRGARVRQLGLLRLNPAVEHKTRGNAAIAVHTDADTAVAFETGRAVLSDLAVTDDERTQPGMVVAPEPVESRVASFSRRAVRELLDLEEAIEIIDTVNYERFGLDGGRGQIGALAAVGAHLAFDDWTYEYIAYRKPDAWGTPRAVEEASVFEAADEYYPDAWDTVDRGEGEAVCVPNAPGPILYGIRGDDPVAVAGVAAGIESEPVHGQALFVTNQGTDAHLQEASLGSVTEDSAFRVTGTVVEAPETRPGGHVFLTVGDGDHRLRCVAFEPTKRFRTHVRSLRVGDVVTVAGEVTDETLKLEKFAVRSLETTKLEPPDCPDCGNRMESAGAGQGYRCRDCKTRADSKVERPISRDLETGWYEVPPCARRHIAKPLIRGGFDGPVHPER
ncbi:MAG: DUF1743 domain-containing protein [Halodesulfurarchaeum sp.]